MKIGILTHYQVESHGALLQHYALTEVLRQMGHDVHTLTYTKNLDFASRQDGKKFSVGLKSVPFYLREYLLKKGPGFVWTMAKKHFVLRAFQRHFSRCSYANGGMDLAIVGSDEVWSIQLGANMMMYGHGIDAARVISYAPSFGQATRSELAEHRCLALVSGGLHTFDALSVRDPASQALVHQLTGKDAALVCDPALLYGFEKELAQFRKMTRRKYVVVYAYNRNMNEPERIAAIRAYAKRIGARVYSVGAFHKWCDRQITCDPLELLFWFKGAEAVFTDTFHGTICALLGQTPMAVYVRDTNHVKLEHLLSVLQLESRRVTATRDVETVLSQPLDFDALRRALQPFREESMHWLERAIQTQE